MPTTDSRDSPASPVSPYDGASSTGTLSDSDGEGDSGLGLKRFPNANASTSTYTEEPEDMGFGHPLQRMVNLETLDERSEGFLGNHALYRMPVAGSSSTSSHYYFVDFEAVVDEYLAQYAAVDPQDVVFVQPEPDGPPSNIPSLILRSIPSAGQELAILQHLNAGEVRRDPWNPAPRLLYAATKGERTVLCLERLFEYDQPPFQTVYDVVDYVRQTLEGLSFLHEQRIVHAAYGDHRGVMMDIGRPSMDAFDRAQFPVRYYRISFARAQQLAHDASIHGPLFQKDVRDCGAMLARQFEGVPRVYNKLKSLTGAMMGRAFGAEDARKLFEALCKSIDSATYETRLDAPQPRPPPQLQRAATVHPGLSRAGESEATREGQGRPAVARSRSSPVPVRVEEEEEE